MKKLFLLLIIVAGYVTYWYNSNAKNDIIFESNSKDQPDFTAKDLENYEYNNQGLLTSIVKANSMEHYENINQTIFTNPNYLIYLHSSEQIWNISAGVGTLTKKNTEKGELYLQQDVKAKVSGDNLPIDTLTSDNVYINLNTMMLMSKDPVHIKGPGVTVDGLGVRANLNTEFITLLKQVEGVYENKK